MNPKILEEICVDKMPYGKHKGVTLIDIPIHYLEWMNRKGFPKGALGMKLATVYEIKTNGLIDLIQPIRYNLINKR